MKVNKFRQGEFYPPVEDQERIKRYKQNKELFKGNHHDLFRSMNLTRSGRFYLSVNLAGIIVKKSADFLLGDGVTISAGKEEHSNEQEALERLASDNEMDIQLYESALGNSYRGDSFFKVRYGQEHGGDLPSAIDPYKVRIEPVPAEFVFPEESMYSAKKHTAYHIAIPVRHKRNRTGDHWDSWRLEVESHYAGRIEYYTYKMRVIESTTDGKPKVWKIGALVEDDSKATGVNLPLVVHVPNYATDDNALGLDDLTELRSLFDELNNRFTQIASILDKHADPAMAIPDGIMEVDEHGRPFFKVSETKVFEVDKKDIIPQYITWNGQLQSAYEEIDRLTTQILTIAELPEVALGLGQSGTSGSSGFAIKWRMNSLLSKIKRKRKYYEQGLQRVFLLAQMLEHAHDVADYEITKPKFVFSDGLPRDEGEVTSIMLQKTGGAVLKSRKTALMELEGLTEEQAEAEIARIKEEESEERAAEPVGTPSFFNDVMDEMEELDAQDESVDEDTS